MAAVADTINLYEVETGLSDAANSPYGMIEGFVVVSDTADATNTVAVTLADFGITTFKYVQGYAHSTNNAVIITEAPTTSVTTGVLTITIPAGTDNDIRVWRIGGI